LRTNQYKFKSDNPTKWFILKCIFFWGLLAVFCALTLYMPIRPSFSETEKRELAKFPAFSADSLVHGTYYRKIDSWFADTFPFRDQFMMLNSQISALHGIRSLEIQGDTTKQGDEIPTPPAW